MEIKQSEFITSAVSPNQYPKDDKPEIAFVGRSNVGKSSLINGVTNRKNLARVAGKPGKTRVINFYRVNQDLFLVDLPGYGYAQVSKAEKESWSEMIETYLNTRAQLKAVLMLVDIRHAPTADDRMMLDWLKAQDRPYLIIATKLDKISRSQINLRIREIRSVLGLGENANVIPFSAENGQGRDEIWKWIEQHV
jgi:GTP-binding protein